MTGHLLADELRNLASRHSGRTELGIEERLRHLPGPNVAKDAFRRRGWPRALHRPGNDARSGLEADVIDTRVLKERDHPDERRASDRTKRRGPAKDDRGFPRAKGCTRRTKEQGTRQKNSAEKKTPSETSVHINLRGEGAGCDGGLDGFARADAEACVRGGGGAMGPRTMRSFRPNESVTRCARIPRRRSSSARSRRARTGSRR